jgi:ABC-type multidrug transport system fused ATPase/permease subunit
MSFRTEFKKIGLVIGLAKQAFGEYKFKIVLLTILGFFSGLLGGVGINAMIPLLSMTAGGVGGDDFISRAVESMFLYLHIDFTLKYLFIFIILLFMLKAVVLVFFSMISVYVTTGYEEKTRTKLLQLVLKADWPFLLKEKLGHFGTVLLINVQHSKSLFTQISLVIMSLTSAIAYFIIAFNISATLTFLAVALGLLLFIPFKFLAKQIRKISYESESINRETSHFVNENILGMKTVKVMSVEEKILEVGKKYFEKIKKISIKSFLIGIPTNNLIEPMSIIFIAIIFGISYKFFSFSLTSLIAVIYLIKQIFVYIVQIQKQVLGMHATVPYLKKVLEYEDMTLSHAEPNSGSKQFEFNKELEFKNVHFEYSSGKEVLSKMNFKIKKGQMVGIVGGSGVGKTTITDLILRLFQPSKGEVLIDGTNILEVGLEEWRKNIGYVSQDIFLKNGSIAENIRFYNEELSDADLVRAAKMADIHDFIKNLPDGFSTLVGERGVMLSGGQRQRIILARILAKKPKILILDEATSALDNKSEVEIQEAIKKIKGHITIIVIAHRLSTVMHADKLLYVEGGKVIEEGNPQDLLKDESSRFSKVYNLVEI